MTVQRIDAPATLRAGTAGIGAAVRAVPVALGLLAVAVVALAVASLMRLALGWLALLAVLKLAAAVLALGALLRRLMVASDDTGGGLGWTPVESRLLGASLLAGFFYFLASLFALVIIVLAVAGVAFATGGIAVRPDPAAQTPALWACGIVVCLYLVALVWSGARLSLLAPATVAAGRIQVFSTWPLTRGRFWPVFAVLLVSSLPALVVRGIETWIVAAIHNADEAVSLPVALALAVPVALIAAFVQAPLTAGVLAALYRDCVGDESPQSPVARAALPASAV